MVVLVSDTSVLVDLERGQLLDAAFGCGLSMAVPDLLYQRELLDFNGPFLRTLGLGVLSLTPSEVDLAQRLQTARKALSLPDCFALSCATRPGHTLLTGDRNLRNEAESRQVAVMGLLGLLDRMALANVDQVRLHQGLQLISNHPRCRLPREEVRVRLQSWPAP